MENAVPNDFGVARAAIANRKLELEKLPPSGPGSLSYIFCADRLSMSIEDVLDMEVSIKQYADKMAKIDPYAAKSKREREDLKGQLSMLLKQLRAARQEMRDIVEVELQDIYEQTVVHWGDEGAMCWAEDGRFAD